MVRRQLSVVFSVSSTQTIIGSSSRLPPAADAAAAAAAAVTKTGTQRWELFVSTHTYTGASTHVLTKIQNKKPSTSFTADATCRVHSHIPCTNHVVENEKATGQIQPPL